ncbi:MAG: hypothetical protein KDA74_21030, partial [Planctomycetaceae bacterium]|nr:hypothetical protein [Planctomycetaceae bacterium]
MRFHTRARLTPVRLLTTLITSSFATLLSSAPLLAAETSADQIVDADNSTVVISWCIAIAGAMFALFTAYRFFSWMVNESE